MSVNTNIIGVPISRSFGVQQQQSPTSDQHFSVHSMKTIAAAIASLDNDTEPPSHLRPASPSLITFSPADTPFTEPTSLRSHSSSVSSEPVTVVPHPPPGRKSGLSLTSPSPEAQVLTSPNTFPPALPQEDYGNADDEADNISIVSRSSVSSRSSISGRTHRKRHSIVEIIQSPIDSLRASTHTILEPDPSSPPVDQESRHPIAFLRRRPLLTALVEAAFIFLLSSIILIFLIKILLPPIEDPKDMEKVKIPKSFDDLKALNTVLQVYKEKNYSRVLGTYICVYLFLQAFSLPGSMYLSILAGAMYGVAMALPLACFCVATGALLCYLISALIGPALLAHSTKWRNRVERWRSRVEKQGGNVISYLIVLRIAPLPPHWVVNVVCPHLGIGMGTFWIATFLGIMGVSFIHTQIGTTLDQMTSSDDFHLISWRNFFGLSGVVVAVMIPVAIRYAWRSELEDAAHESDEEADTLPTHSTPSLAYPTNSDVDDRSSFISNASLQSVESVDYEAYSSDGSADEQQPFVKRKKRGPPTPKKGKDQMFDFLGKVGVGKGKEKENKLKAAGKKKAKAAALPLQLKGESSSIPSV